MDNPEAQMLANSNHEMVDAHKRLIEAIGMHWANIEALQKKETPPYCEQEFHNVAYRPY